MKTDFITQKPTNDFLATIIDYYFYIDIPVDALALHEEYIIPFPRITFGYFFEHPFLATNYTLKKTEIINMGISRISTDKVTVKPLTEKVKIIGAHAKPYALAYLTKKSISELPWLIKTLETFEEMFVFPAEITSCSDPKDMFEVIEKAFLDRIITRNLEIIQKAINLIEESRGTITLSSIAEQTGISGRALRDKFHKHIGCAPKEYISLVKLKSSVHQMNTTDDLLTEISYDNNYFDQPHFNNTFKQITGKSPKTLRKEMPYFRFLQF